MSEQTSNPEITTTAPASYPSRIVYRGRVESMDDKDASVLLVDEQENRYTAVCDASTMTDKNIDIGDEFILELLQLAANQPCELLVSKAEPGKLSEEDIKAIHDKYADM